MKRSHHKMKEKLKWISLNDMIDIIETCLRLLVRIYTKAFKLIHLHNAHSHHFTKSLIALITYHMYKKGLSSSWKARLGRKSMLRNLVSICLMLTPKGTTTFIFTLIFFHIERVVQFKNEMRHKVNFLWR